MTSCEEFAKAKLVKPVKIYRQKLQPYELEEIEGGSDNRPYDKFITGTGVEVISELSALLRNSDDVKVMFTEDVTIPLREDGKIDTLAIGPGKKLDVDLGGNDMNVQAYAFYVNGGELIIRDSTGKGSIIATMPGQAYPAVYVNNGKCTMISGCVDTTKVEVPEGSYNWLYNVVCFNDGIFDMQGGELKVGGGAGVSITNGKATGAGAQFIFGGDSVVNVDGGEAAIYLADNKKIVVKDNAVINGTVTMRMGDLTVQDNGKIIVPQTQTTVEDFEENLATAATYSGCVSVGTAVLALTGVYNSALGNDMNVTIKDSARIVSKFTAPIIIATIDTLYDQVVNFDIKCEDNLKNESEVPNAIVLYDHDALAAVCAAQGKTLAAKKSETTLTVKMTGEEIVVPPVDATTSVVGPVGGDPIEDSGNEF